MLHCPAVHEQSAVHSLAGTASSATTSTACTVPTGTLVATADSRMEAGKEGALALNARTDWLRERAKVHP